MSTNRLAPSAQTEVADKPVLMPAKETPKGHQWAYRWVDPPPDRAIETVPPGARDEAASQIGTHIVQQLGEGRSLYCIVHDQEIKSRIGEFDGRALPSHCLTGTNP